MGVRRCPCRLMHAPAVPVQRGSRMLYAAVDHMEILEFAWCSSIRQENVNKDSLFWSLLGNVSESNNVEIKCYS